LALETDAFQLSRREDNKKIQSFREKMENNTSFVMSVSGNNFSENKDDGNYRI